MHLTATALLRPVLSAGLASGLALTGAAASTADTGTNTTGTRVTAATGTQAPGPATEDGKLLLMLDASGSMKEKDPAGGTKMDAAKKALTGVVNELPKDTRVGLRVYGATEEGGKPTKAACADTQLAAPIEPLDKPALKRAITGFEAKGETPIAHSLKKGLADLGSKGKRNIVLVSDGEESCVPDPCPSIKKLVKDGVDLRIDTVGFDVEDTARKQLTCIAETGGGTYYDAADADELATRLSKLSQRAARDFAFTGAPVTGTDLAEDQQPPADLPTLTPGLWTDELTASEDSWRAYRVERTQKQSTLHVSLTSKPNSYYNREDDDDELEKLEMKALAPDGTVCFSRFTYQGDHLGFRPIVTVTGRVLGQSIEDHRDDEACQKKGTFTVLVHREGADPTTSTEIQVIEEPRVTNLTELSEGVEEYPKEKELSSGTPKTIAGGLSFSDAPQVTNGTWVDTLVPGETLLYRVKVEDGQTARFTANGPTGGFRFPADAANHHQLWVDGVVFSPDRQEVGSGINLPGSFTPRSGSSDPKSVSTTQLRYKNRYQSDQPGGPENLSASSMSGWYYYAVSVSTEDVGESLEGQPIKVAFTIDVEGKPSDAVEYDAAGDWNPAAADDEQSGSASEEASAAAADDGRPSWFRWLGGGLLTVALLGAGAWFMRRRLITS